MRKAASLMIALTCFALVAALLLAAILLDNVDVSNWMYPR